MKKEIMPGAPTIEQEKVANATEVLLVAAKQGVAPPPEVRKQLTDLWQQVVDVETAKAKESAPKIDKVKSRQMIEKYVYDENNGPGLRNIEHYCNKFGMNMKNFDWSAVLPAMEIALKKNESLEVIARYLTLCHDCAPEWGGGQHIGFHMQLPRVSRLVLEKLRKELQAGNYDLTDRCFLYALHRAGAGQWEYVARNMDYDVKNMTENDKLMIALDVSIGERKKWEAEMKEKGK